MTVVGFPIDPAGGDSLVNPDDPPIVAVGEGVMVIPETVWVGVGVGEKVAVGGMVVWVDVAMKVVVGGMGV